MRILLISDLPEILGPFGLKHHYPAVLPAPDDGMTFVRHDAPEELPVEVLLRDARTGGPAVAHLSGTSERILRVASDLRAASVPLLYTPFLPSFPAPAGRLAEMLSGSRTGAGGSLAMAGKIASEAGAILARNAGEAKYLQKKLGVHWPKIFTVPEPGFTDPAFSVPRPFANLAAAFCDSLAPEWNVLRLLFALEKINADAVIVAGRTDTPYARDCASRAAGNPRVRLTLFERGGAGRLAGEAVEIVRRASVIVDPSLRGLAGAAAAAASAAGIPAVVSLSSVRSAEEPRSPAAGGIFPFEPTSWELLNHSLTCAFNRAALGAGGGERAPHASGEGAASGNMRIAETLRSLYRTMA